jgi:tetratricopeptide (TPR) repeat protein
MFPTITEYNKVIQSKSEEAFQSLTGLTFIPSRTLPVKIYSYGAGSYAVVFKAEGDLRKYAIRCFISAEQENIDRYRTIDQYLSGIDASWVTKLELLEDEIEVDGELYPVVKMEWVEGQLLNSFIDKVLHDNDALTVLQKEIVDVSKSLEKHKVGHGDIQCGNVIISQNSKGNYRVKLIDYDGLYLPAFANKPNLERGRSEFQHPNRSQSDYNERIDRFSFWVILTALEALKYDKTLWKEVMQGGFNTLDNLLFTGEDFKNFTNSKLVNRLKRLNQPSLTYYLECLKIYIDISPSNIGTPTLYGSSNFKKVDKKHKPKSTNESGYEELEIITSPAGARVLTSTFEHLGTTPLTLNKRKVINQTLVISYGTKIKQAEVLANEDIIKIDFDDTISQLESKSLLHDQENVNLNTETDSTSVESSTKGKSKINGWAVAAFGLLGIVFIMLIVSATLYYNEEDSIVVEATPESKASIEKIEVDNHSTIITFKYLNNGGHAWVNISPSAIIRSSVDNSIQLNLKDVQGIPLAPEQYNLTNASEVVYFKVIFPPLDRNITEIDFIECDESSCFNLYNQKVDVNTNETSNSESLSFHNQGVEYYNNKDYKNAEQYFSKAIQSNKQDPNNYDWRGWAKFHQKKYKGAVSDFLIASELEPNNARHYQSIGHTKTWLDQWESAANYYTKAIEKDRSNPVYYFDRAEVNRINGKLKAALDDISESLRLDPQNGSYFNERGLIKLGLGQRESSCADFTRAIDLGNEDAKVNYRDNCR